MKLALKFIPSVIGMAVALLSASTPTSINLRRVSPGASIRGPITLGSLSAKATKEDLTSVATEAAGDLWGTIMLTNGGRAKVRTFKVSVNQKTEQAAQSNVEFGLFFYSASRWEGNTAGMAATTIPNTAPGTILANYALADANAGGELDSVKVRLTIPADGGVHDFFITTVVEYEDSYAVPEEAYLFTPSGAATVDNGTGVGYGLSGLVSGSGTTVTVTPVVEGSPEETELALSIGSAIQNPDKIAEVNAVYPDFHDAHGESMPFSRNQLRGLSMFQPRSNDAVPFPNPKSRSEVTANREAARSRYDREQG